jgi:hypothetical protein
MMLHRPLLRPFAVVFTPCAAGWAFACAATRRVGPRHLMLAALGFGALAAVGAAGIMSAIWGAPSSAKLARAVEMAVIAPLMVIAIVAADEAVERGMSRALSYSVAVVTAAAVGALLGWELRAALGFDFVPKGVPIVLNAGHPYFHRLDMALISSLIGGLAAFVHVKRRTALAARRRQHDAELARARAQRRTLESQLQALQARVEPMFLFGTLERIQQLYRSDAPAGGAMLEDLIVYLRAALPHLRESSSSVAQELTLARSWLDIVGRAAPHWHVDVHASDAVLAARMPALVMLPLVQCAVDDAAAAPLRLRLDAQLEGARLRIGVTTSTDAFVTTGGHPVLEQVAARMRALYGDAARLETVPLDAGTSSARIELPLEQPDVQDLRGTP